MGVIISHATDKITWTLYFQGKKENDDMSYSDELDASTWIWALGKNGMTSAQTNDVESIPFNNNITECMQKEAASARNV